MDSPVQPPVAAAPSLRVPDRTVFSTIGLVLRVAAVVVTTALLATILYSTVRLDWVPVTLLVALSALAVLAAWRPAEALLIVAALTPIATYVGQRWNSGVNWPETMVIAFCAGWMLRLLRRTRPDAVPQPLALPALTFAAVVAVSMAIGVWVLVVQLGPSEPIEFITRHYFLRTPQWRTVHSGALMLEGMALLCAAAGAARDPRFVSRGVSMLVAGGSAAALINVLRLFESAVRSDDVVATFVRLFATVRINVHHGDLNAAGSTFAMLLAVAAVLTMQRHRVLWLPASGVLGLGVWVSGSRVAMMALAVAAALLLVVRLSAGNRFRVRTRWVAGAALAGALIIAAASLPHRGVQQSAPIALQVRTELLATGIRMLAESPLFGIGVGQFYQRSGEFSSPELLALFPAARNENAHNNYMQVLAEMGLAGFLAVLWLIGASVTAIARRASAHRGDLLVWGAGAGVLVFLLTCLGGHPLLIPESAYAFWLLLGATAGASLQATSHEGESRTRASTLAVAVALAAIAASLPIRGRIAAGETNLEHVGRGVSAWQYDELGARFRYGGRDSTLFVPADAGSIFVPLRAAHAIESIQVELRLDGALANVVRVTREQWRNALIVMPARSQGPAFRRLDLHVRESEAQGHVDVLMIGKVEPH